MAHRGTPMWLGDQNAARALRLMLEYGPVSRNGLAKLAGQSKPTASQLIARLEEKRLVTPIGQEAIGRGPAATVYAPSSDRFYGVAINIDQSGVRSTAVDVLGTEHPVASRPAEGLGGGRSAARDVGGAVLAACELAGIDLSRVDTVCIGVPSSVDRRSDELSSVEALPGWSRKAITRHLEDALGCRVIVDNDVDLAAVAERRIGYLDASASFALVWVGYGLGLALDIGGTVLRGASGSAGEIGHLPVVRGMADSGSEPVDLEDCLGARAVDRVARDVRETSWTFADGLAGSPMPARVAEVVASRLALGVIPVLGVADPDLVILGGPIGRAGGAQLAELTRASVRNRSRWDPTILVSRIESDPVLLGATAAVREEIRQSLVALADSETSADDQVAGITAKLRRMI